ncbi:hypothetical protein [Cardinium endosymbiont of Culicoides punctatus]|uniref:hypothetical protein n=1 Tax=Cardinium endosymbiont of Culicoides punctatus TaxID=2304601 RepID=UPI0010586D5A|nr:hypothetical protein [Cardinium endosymbiont of Culicoides punctatus]TDG95299.1 hypothetical protein CCPUN_04910 [Cardinium endosymbiont of Culicoides punctatus]
MHRSILWTTLFYALGACSQKRVSQNIRLDKALTAGCALSAPLISHGMAIPSNNTVPFNGSSIDLNDPNSLNNTFIPMIIEVKNTTKSLEDLNPDDIKVYFPEIHEIQATSHGAIDFQQLKVITAQDDDPIVTPIEPPTSKVLPIAGITFTQKAAINLLGFISKRCNAGKRKQDTYSEDCGAHIALAKGGIYIVLMSVAYYIELNEGFNRPDLLTLWANGGVSLFSLGGNMCRSKKKQGAIVEAGLSACLNTIPAIVVTSISPNEHYNTKIMTAWMGTADLALATVCRLWRVTYSSSSDDTHSWPYQKSMLIKGTIFTIASGTIAILVTVDKMPGV